jgi:hypothetical protein
MKVLQIIESAYRGTLEEQDDTIVWLTHCLRGAGAELTVLLKDNAVNYVLLGQDASGLSFGSWKQTQPPRIADDIAALIAKGVGVLVTKEDLDTRGLLEVPRVEGAQLVSRKDLPRLAEDHDQVWHW